VERVQDWRPEAIHTSSNVCLSESLRPHALEIVLSLRSHPEGRGSAEIFCKRNAVLAMTAFARAKTLNPGAWYARKHVRPHRRQILRTEESHSELAEMDRR